MSILVIMYLLGSILFTILVQICLASKTETTQIISVPPSPPEEIEKSKPSIYFNVGHEFERKYGSWNITVERFCEIDKGPRETNIVASYIDDVSGDEYNIQTYGYHPTLVGNLENLLKSGTPKEIDDFNAGRLAYVEEKGKETLTIMDNSSVLEKGTKQVEALRQGYEEIATHKSPELQWKKEFDEI